MTKRMENAVRKAKQVKCHARSLGGRRYEVTNPRGHRYTVRMELRDGQRYAICNCAAGTANQPCYHIIGAALLDTAITGCPLETN
jgi:hypothetical protein